MHSFDDSFLSKFKFIILNSILYILFLKFSLNTLLMLMSKGCSFHVRSLGTINLAVSNSFNFNFTLIVLCLNALSRASNAFHFKLKISITFILLEFITNNTLAVAYILLSINKYSFVLPTFYFLQSFLYALSLL